MHGRLWGAFGALLLVASFSAGAGPVTAETTVPPTTTVPGATDGSSTTSTSSTSTSTTTSTTTTTLPSAVTTVPEGCSLPPTAQAVFTGTVTTVDPVTATFTVAGVRAGSLEGYVGAAGVQVRYGADVKFLEVGSEYIVGVALDPVSQQLSSTVRDSAELFGGNEVVGGGADCPEFEAVARTLNMDGTSIESGVFSNFLGDPLRLLAAVVLPFVLVLVALVAAVWVRRGTRR
ncbi:MAG: hypothetical protein ACKOBO_07960 [Acidimicrobiales bacterium]